MTDPATTALIGAASDKKLLIQVYGDLAKPGVSEVGRALSTVLGLGNTILWPLQLLNEKAKINLQSSLECYREKLSKIPPEKVAPVAPEVGVPIVEKLTYVSDPELRELYTNLLARASNSDTQHKAHPSFVNVINNMAPDEAHLLRDFFKRAGRIAFVDGRFTQKNGPAWVAVEELYFTLLPETRLTFPQNLAAYVSNLQGLGVLEVSNTTYFTNAALYEPLIKYLESKYSQTPCPKDLPEFKVEKGAIEITRYGFLFAETCI